MATLHGRRGRVYLGLSSSTAVATPLPFLASWSISFESEKVEVTSFGDLNKTYVAGLPDASGEFSGFYDDTTVQTYTAATDGLPRKFYLYPSTSNTGQYWFGEIKRSPCLATGMRKSRELLGSPIRRLCHNVGRKPKRDGLKNRR